MRNQIITTFLVLAAISNYIVIGSKEEQTGNIKKNYKQDNIKKINVFKWTSDKDYRRNLIKRINEKL